MNLKEIRENIDDIDEKILNLYKERTKITAKVIDYKIKNNKAVFDKTREDQKIEFAKGIVEDEHIAEDVSYFMKSIMTLSRKNQYHILQENISYDIKKVSSLLRKDIRVAYQGELGGYGYLAMKKYFGDYGLQKSYKTFKNLALAVEKGEVDYGVLPIENSIAGEVTEIYDILASYGVYVVQEIDYNIEHVLLGKKGIKEQNITDIYSHPQALMQCSNYLDSINKVNINSTLNTALAVKNVASSQEIGVAAIGSVEAGKIFGLEVIKRNIANENDNVTKFIIISNEKKKLINSKKILVSFNLPDKAGTLYDTLSHIICNNLNMTKIFSRPLRDYKWEYCFFVEFQGDVEDKLVRTALLGLKEETKNFKLIGAYS